MGLKSQNSSLRNSSDSSEPQGLRADSVVTSPEKTIIEVGLIVPTDQPDEEVAAIFSLTASPSDCRKS